MKEAACKYCGFVAYRASDEDCPAKPRWLRLWHWLRSVFQ